MLLRLISMLGSERSESKGEKWGVDKAFTSIVSDMPIQFLLLAG